MTPDPSSPSPADSVTKVLVVADCENKEKLLSEVRAYQMVDRGRKDASSGESSPGVVEVKDGPDFTLTFCEVMPLSEKDLRSAESNQVVQAPVRSKVVIPVQLVPNLINALKEHMRLFSDSANTPSWPQGPVH